jgi:NADH dehydrogenase
MYAWRSFYLSESVSMRTRALLLGDYVKRGIWGRDLSRI